MLSLEGKATSFFQLIEIMAANLRALLGAYMGAIAWPSMQMPVDLADLDQRHELRTHYQAAATQLGLLPAPEARDDPFVRYAPDDDGEEE
jgi:hypothetical protein